MPLNDARAIPLSSKQGWLHFPENHDVALCFLLVLLTFLVYSPVGRHQFVNFDDDRYITGNAHVKAGLAWTTVS